MNKKHNQEKPDLLQDHILQVKMMFLILTWLIMPSVSII